MRTNISLPRTLFCFRCNFTFPKVGYVGCGPPPINGTPEPKHEYNHLGDRWNTGRGPQKGWSVLGGSSHLVSGH